MIRPGSHAVGVLAEEITALGISAESDAFHELIEAALEEAKTLGTHGGNVLRDLNATKVARDVDRYHDLRRSRTASARASLLNRQVTFQRDLTRLVDDFQGGRIDERKFREDAKAALRRAYISNFVHGLETAGHHVKKADLYKELSDEDARWLRSAYNHELTFFNRFLDAIVRGISMKETHRRILAYARASSNIFDSGRMLTLPENTVIFWLLESDNPCRGCIHLWQNSPYTKDTLPTTPKAGATPCLHNCYCRLRIKTATVAEVDRVRSRHGGSPARLLSALAKIKSGR